MSTLMSVTLTRCSSVAAQSLCDKLAKLHSLNIVHANFKAFNIMVLKDREGFLAEFETAEIWSNVQIS